MLPARIRIEHLDQGVKNLVVNLNRIPNVNTLTNCEGHIWTWCPNWPTKDGWVYVTRPNEEHGNLLERLRDKCASTDFMTLQTYAEFDKETWYIIEAHFENHENGGLFSRITPREQKNYFRRAYKRKEKIIEAWKSLNRGVLDYIWEDLEIDPRTLPYRQTGTQTRQIIRPCFV